MINGLGRFRVNRSVTRILQLQIQSCTQIVGNREKRTQRVGIGRSQRCIQRNGEVTAIKIILMQENRRFGNTLGSPQEITHGIELREAGQTGSFCHIIGIEGFLGSHHKIKLHVQSHDIFVELLSSLDDLVRGFRIAVGFQGNADLLHGTGKALGRFPFL